MESLDNILSGRSEAVPAQETQDQGTTQTAATDTTGDAGQTTEQQEGTTEGDKPTTEGGKQPPIGAIRQAEREKATKRYTEQVADFEKRLEQNNADWERRFNTLVEKLRPQQTQEPPPKPDYFADPDAAVDYRVDHRLTQAVNPHFDRINQAMMHNSRLIASQLHTEDVVKAADDAFAKAVAARAIDPAEAQRVLGSPNVYDAAVRWHKRQQLQAEIGDDPAAYRERLKAELIAELQGQASGGQQADVTQQRAVPVMPSNLAAVRNVGNRSGPAWGGPVTLKDIFKR